jgi:hypothetical protein
MAGMSTEALTTTCVRLRSAKDVTGPLQGTNLTVRSLARHYQALTIEALVTQAPHRKRPRTRTAAQPLITCGDNPDRLSPGGHRQADRALHLITRMASRPPNPASPEQP